MRRSEIFESFAKIAQEKGLVSDDKPTNQRVAPEHTEKDFHETNPRHDSLSIEQISKLYNTKPEQPEDMKYKKNIMEDAHPEPVVLFMSHDKLNSLVENEIEGQNIRLRIVTKEPDGHLVQRKYAKEELVHNLVRIANDLDNRDQEDLRKLADACLMQASGFRKVAFWWYAIAAAVGLLYAKQHLRFHSDGFKADYQKALAEIDDMLGSASSIQTTLGAGYEYTPQFLQTLQKLKEELGKLNAEVEKVTPLLDKIETPKTGPELKELSQQTAVQEGTQALQEFQTVLKEVYPFVSQVVTEFGNEGYKQRMISHKGWLANLIDVPEVLHGGMGLIADDFDDVKHALQTVMSDIQNIIKDLQGVTSVQQDAASKLQAAESKEQSMFGGSTPAAPAEGEGEKPGEGGGGALSSLEEGAKHLFGL